MKMNTINSVVESKLCTGCGTCVTACPKKTITMRESVGGFLFARVELAGCNDCGLCLKICPGLKLNFETFSEEVDPFKGNILGAFIGHSKDSEIRKNAQSGGVVTALYKYLLDKKIVDSVVGTQMVCKDKPRPENLMVSSVDQFRKTQTSKYCPVPLNASIPFNLKDHKIALTGLACHLHGIHNVQAINKRWAENIAFKIGLVCDRTLSYHAIDYLAAKAKVPLDNIAEFKYRNKLSGDLHLVDNGGNQYSVPNKHRIFCKDFFTPTRCRLCFDKLNIYSDLTVGDAWGVKEDNKGNSAILVRTTLGSEILNQAAQEGYLELEEVSAQTIIEGQAYQNRRKSWTAYSASWNSMGRKLPEAGIPQCWKGDPDAGTIKSCSDQIRWTDKLEESSSPEQAYKKARNKIMFSELKSKVGLRTRLRNLLNEFI